MSATAALLVLERLVLVVSERTFLRPVLVALLAGSRADGAAASAAALPAWASAGALLRVQSSQSQDFGRQFKCTSGLSDGPADAEEVSARCPHQAPCNVPRWLVSVQASVPYGCTP